MTAPLLQKVGSIYYWYQNDHLGTPQKLIGTNGLVVWSATYDSFGNVQIGVEDTTSNLRFPGQYYDPETGLHYNWNRYYDPGIGRYLRTDPFGAGLKLYVYCFNNPHYWIDPLGLCAEGPDDLTIWLDVVAVGGDVISLVPTPYTMIGGYALSEAASVTNLYRIEKQYTQDKATGVDLWVTRVTTVVSTIPGPIGLVGSGSQLTYDILRRIIGP
jgi:RHS repeat-associated protein